MQEDLSGATTTVVAAEEKAPVDDDTAAAGLRLREYQLEGVNWLVWTWYNSRPSILADEM
jgi:SNF2 family DNA or RNA helicase